ncbi:unannotated protein [freshwater metagenome]|uniref:leucyl aminopeptidase n=1 Tax=freshwater metagenome TaxID=449393 RepID=A0A6J7DJB6_9ZZZZ|nr:leucyl aminopeptidase [Actinomycetota bacterium]
MDVVATTNPPAESGADTVALGIFAGEDPDPDAAGGAIAALLAAGEARAATGQIAVTHADGLRWIVIGLGKRDAFDPEAARMAAHRVCARAAELGSEALCWQLPHRCEDALAGALIEGSLLSAYRFDRFRSQRNEDERPGGPQRLILSAGRDLGAFAARAVTVTRAQNAARDLQNRPSNDLTPSALAERAAELVASTPGLTFEALGREQIEARGMGAFACVAQGSAQEPRAIVMHHTPKHARGPALGLVGKAVTFDTGGVSIKPAAGMAKMKFDMSGGAAVLEAMGVIAALEIPVRVIAVIGATENVTSGKAVKPGDIVRAMDGTSIEVDNTDAEGRLVLADCLLLARELGAERLVDVATLTGGIVTALGSVYAGGFASDDAWWGQVAAAADRAGEAVWRMPLHERYAKGVQGTYADLVNTGRDRKAQPAIGAEFLHHFAGDVPWCHLDIAGMADDVGVPYFGKGGTGFGVRLLTALAEDVAGNG